MIVHTLPYLSDGANLLRALVRAGCREPVWLDSAGGFGRYSLIAADPRVVLSSRDGQIRRRVGDGTAEPVATDALTALADELAAGDPEAGPAPFAGGAIGYFGYDLGERLEGVARACSDGDVPEMLVGLYDWVAVTDHATGASWLAGPAADARRALWLGELHASPVPAAAYRGGRVSVDTDRAAYGAAFERVQRYIRDGDCYQVNLARCFTAPFAGDGINAYSRLRHLSPGPYCAYLGLDGLEVLSLSPERFLTLSDGRVETRPIKGTRARGEDAASDAALLAALRASPKDRAENVMIVDLLRNDLGRVCRSGSVRVPELFATESYATVHHLVSTVTGELAPGRDATDLLRATLPGGSITGAPKHRAMEIIAELEPSRRGVYCGAIGYLGYDGGMDTSIAIRTAVRRGDGLEYRAGGGLVWDSRVDEEFAETESKARAFLQFLA